jgi:hypothetical protein
MFNDLLTEHTLWKDDTEKQSLLSIKVNYATIFWINYMGILGLFQKYGNNPKIIQYLKSKKYKWYRKSKWFNGYY